MTAVMTVGIALALIVGIGLVWRWASWPCPAWLVPLLARAGIGPGLRVLDAGCGPGRLSVPAARLVGPAGRVVALDIQTGMLEKLERRVRQEGLPNVELLLAGLGDGRLPSAEFDVALLVTVLGEIPDELAALREIHGSLRPGGVLSITEVLPDPHYQRVARTRSLASEAGFSELAYFPGWLSYTLNVAKTAV